MTKKTGLKLLAAIEILFLVGIGVCITFIFNQSQPVEEEEKTILIDTMPLNRDNFFYVCGQLEIQHPEIVYAQARLESGNFTSRLYREQNNMLGLYNSSKKCYYHFNHWSDCLNFYKSAVQYKYQGGDYYQFLEDLPYAMDEDYITKLKQIVR